MYSNLNKYFSKDQANLSISTLFKKAITEGVVISSRPSVQVLFNLKDDKIINTTLTIAPVFSTLMLGQKNKPLIIKILQWCFSYAEKKIAPISSLPLDLSIISPESIKILQAIKQVPLGSMSSAVEIASKLGYLSKTDLVEDTCKNNPFPLIFPCHRINSDFIKNKEPFFSAPTESILKFELNK